MTLQVLHYPVVVVYPVIVNNGLVSRNLGDLYLSSGAESEHCGAWFNPNKDAPCENHLYNSLPELYMDAEKGLSMIVHAYAILHSCRQNN